MEFIGPSVQSWARMGVGRIRLRVAGSKAEYEETAIEFSETTTIDGEQ